MLGVLTLIGTPALTSAHELVAGDRGHLDLDIEALGGAFHSQENYAQSPSQSAGSSSWLEGFIKYGFSGELGVAGGQAYGAFNLLTSGVGGDGDAAGFSDGTEHLTNIEDAYLGWRSGNLFPTLGQDGVDLSFGRQKITIGNGFLIAGDSLNFGRGISSELNRGGGYYIAARQDFDGTAVLRLGGDEGWRSDLMWLKSNNRAQSDAEMAVATLEHVGDLGTFGATYIDVLDTAEKWDNPRDPRDGTKTGAIRYEGNMSLPDLYLSGEYAWQDRDTGNEHAWYAEAGWTFSDLAWSPSVHYRFSRFSDRFDSLFYGNTRAFGTWFQGEVAGNYAGPFDTNTKVNMISVEASPAENVTLGLLLFDFDTLNDSLGNTDGREADLFGIWGVNKHLSILPLVGLYKPGSHNDTQLGNHDSNIYSQLLVSITF